MKKILFHSQYLLGTGHRFRTMALARAFHHHNFDVMVMDGGYQAQTMKENRFCSVALPCYRAKEGKLTQLCDEYLQPTTEKYHMERRTIAGQYFDDFSPDFFICDGFPFARRSLKSEFLMLFDKAQKSGCKIISSLRDILANDCSNFDFKNHKNIKKNMQIKDIVDHYVEQIWIHGDPNFCPIEKSCPLFHYCPEILKKCLYTGYITDEAYQEKKRTNNNKKHVLVSAGGGAVSKKIWQKTYDLATRHPHIDFHYLKGPHTDFILKERHNITYENNVSREEYHIKLQDAAMIFCQAGYNSAVDVLTTKVPALFYPYQDYGEVEQTLRCRYLQHRHIGTYIDDTSSEEEIDHQFNACFDHYAHKKNHSVMLNGAHNTVLSIKNMIV